MSILQVGANSSYKRISDAVAAARDGDTVEVAAGTYLNDFTQVNAKITLRGVGGMVHMVATERPYDGKAIMTVSNDLVLEHFSFSGAKVADHNGAGIRYQGGHLVVRDSVFHSNENGILANGVADGTILIERSEFSGNGDGSGYTHNLYVGAIKDLTIRDSYFHDAVVGHEIKSRAANTTITGTRILNGSGNASYAVDLPNGGVALLQGNVIQKGRQRREPVHHPFRRRRFATCRVAFKRGQQHHHQRPRVGGRPVQRDRRAGRGHGQQPVRRDGGVARRHG